MWAGDTTPDGDDTLQELASAPVADQVSTGLSPEFTYAGVVPEEQDVPAWLHAVSRSPASPTLTVVVALSVPPSGVLHMRLYTLVV